MEEETQEENYGNVRSLEIEQRTRNSTFSDEAAGFGRYPALPQGRRETTSSGPLDPDDYPNDQSNEVFRAKKHKMLEESSYDEEDASSCIKSQPSAGSSEYENEEMDFKYGAAKNPPNEVVNSVRGNENLSGKRKRENPALGYVPRHPIQLMQRGKQGGFGNFGVTTPSGGSVASISEFQSTTPIKSAGAIVIDDAEGGVFDDAEDDLCFDFPTYIPSNAPVERKALSPPTYASPAKLPRNRAVKPGFGFEEKVKRKRAPHQLNGKKETENALAILAGKDDLLPVLPSEDCHFLAKSLWIFTVQQLEAALEADSTKSDSTDSNERNLRDELLQAVANSALVGDKESGFGAEDLNQDSEKSNNSLDSKKLHKTNGLDEPDTSDSNSELDGSDPPLISLRLSAGLQPSRPSQATNGNVKAAEARLQTWSRMISAWRKKNSEENPRLSFARTTNVEDKFPLDGPVSCLLPRGLQNFLTTLKIFSLSQFISLRKTESGMVTVAFRKWRSLCDFPIVQDVLLSKHLLGITSRVEVAIASVPWADFQTRRWMGCELVVLTGAAREFIIDECNIHDPEEFVTQKTKGLADLLEKWRETKNMPPLKGTGKVAMISGWKTNVKEELSIARAEGTTFHDLDLLEIAETDCRDESVAKISKKKEKVDAASRKQQAGERPLGMEAALRSPQFFKKVLGAEKSSILIAAGIDTAEKLINADKHTSSVLVQKMVEARKSFAYPGSTQPASNMRLLYDWTTKLRGKLDELKNVKESKNKSKAAIKSPVRPESKLNESSERARIDPSHRKDPIDALSATARTFLASQGILLAKDLLTTRTTDIANAFVPWREANDLPVLKGLGAIASVSGWKATVRKASAEMGFPDFVEVAPKHMPCRVATLTPPPKTELRLSITHIEPMTHPELLFGCPSRRFAVRSSKGPLVLFLFELSVRISQVDERSEAVFLSYLGSKQLQPDENNDEQNEGSDDFVRKGQWDSKLNPILPILFQETHEVVDSDSNELPMRTAFGPFSSNFPGRGIIELTQHGVFPLSRKNVKYGQLFSLKRDITTFFDSVSHSVSAETSPAESESEGNISSAARTTGNSFIVTATNRGARCFTYLKDPVERGQVVELQFSSQFSTLRSDPTKVPALIRQRLQVANSICDLASDDVAPVIDFLVTESLHKITKELREALRYTQISIALRKRRRLHWVSSFLLRHGVQGSPISEIVSDARKSAVKKLLWDSEILSTLDSVSDTSKTELLKILTSDVENEILFEMAASGIVNLFSDDSLVCFVADECLKCSLEVVSCHLTKQDLEHTTSNLLAELSGVASNGVALIMGKESDTFVDLELSRRPLGTVAVKADGMDEQEADQGKCYSRNFSTADDSPGENNSIVSRRSLGCGFAAEHCSPERHNEAPINAPDFPKMFLTTRDDLLAGRASLNKRWYIENQVLLVIHAVASAAVSQWPEMEEAYSLSDLRKAAFQAAENSAQQEVDEDEGTTHNFIDVRLFINNGKCSARSEPHPLPIFLGTVWPKLSKLGWRLEIGNRPEKFAFLPPGQASSNRKAKDARVKQIKQERVRRRAKLAKEASETGLGYIPKLSKHLFANAVQVDERGTEEEDTSEYSVASALEKFQSMVESGLPPDNTSSNGRIGTIVEQIRACFNDLAPRLVLTDENSRYSVATGQEPSEVYGCQYLMRFLLVLPGILHEASVPPEQLQDMLSVVKELLDFLAKNHQDLFDESFYPPEEQLETEERCEPFLAPKLGQLSATSEKADVEKSDQPYLAEGADVIVLPSDRPSLTNFVDLVMSQFLVCRATVEDAGKKNRRIQPGHPGLWCRHCRGDGGEGRYFFSSVESLTTAATVIEKHIARCPKVPEDIKTRMVQYRAKHGEQRLHLQSGSLGAYYARLYDRLILSKPGGDSAVYIKPVADSFKDEPMSSVSSASGAGVDDTEAALEFPSHIHLLEYIKQTGTWYNKQEVIDGMEEYYKCLDFGGRIFGTNAMPSHFSAEWVLGKVGPRTKNRFHQKSE